MSDLADSLLAAFQLDRGDRRLIRAELILSEAAEVLGALASRDEVELADGLGDLSYVVHGTALTYEIPMGPVVEEIHRSNMTKNNAQDAVNNHDGDKGKDHDGYSPPDVRGAIDGDLAGDRAGLVVGRRLSTRDGRRAGNATVTAELPGCLEIQTDYGNHLTLTVSEIRELYHDDNGDAEDAR